MRVAVLFGGRSVEHDVSLRSARTVLDALDPARFEAIPVAVTRQGRWRAGEAAESLLRGAPGDAAASEWLVLPDPNVGGLAGPADDGWRTLPVDVVFPLVHGGQGEDGTLQGLLELADLPYVGSGVTASALGMDKRQQRKLFALAGLPTLPTLEIRRWRWESSRQEERRRILQEVGLPCFVKPGRSGSSVGVVKVRREEELEPGVDLAARYDSIVLVEPAREVRELECAVLGNREPRAAGPGEIVPGREFYDYRAKYLEDTSQLLVPAPVGSGTAAELRRMAVEAFQVLGCAGLARVDFFLEQGDDRIWLNEINTLPGFTSISMYPRVWEHAGIAVPELVSRLVDLALERHADRARNRKDFSEAES